MPCMPTIFIIQKEMISMHDEEYFESFGGSPEEQENYHLRTQVESRLLPRYIEEIRKIASEIVDVLPEVMAATDFRLCGFTTECFKHNFHFKLGGESSSFGHRILPSNRLSL